jgi:hypothetical protein
MLKDTIDVAAGQARIVNDAKAAQAFDTRECDYGSPEPESVGLR